MYQASERALTKGISWNAVALMLYAFVPTLFGMSAYVTNPGITDENLVLPTVLRDHLPAALGALALAAYSPRKSTPVTPCSS